LVTEMSANRIGDIKTALERWGKGKRPQSTINGFLDFRRTINKSPPKSFHPYESIIKNWELDAKFLLPKQVEESVSYVFINTEKDLATLSRDLAAEDVIAFDTESYNQNVYLAMICVLQISTARKDYIIDCLQLFDKINVYLNPIFSNQNQLKLVHDTQDIRFLQRDFSIFCTGVIDTQEVFGIKYPDQKQVSLAKMVQHYLGVEVNKLPQLADWRVRPLPDDLKAYAANDSRYLLLCWEKLKLEFLNNTGNTLVLEEFPVSKRGTLALFAFPKQRSVEYLWKQYVESLSNDLKLVFNTKLQFEMFSEIHDWREREAKNLDLNPKFLLEEEAFPKICRSMPTSLAKLQQIIGSRYSISLSLRESLFGIVDKYRDRLTSTANRIPPEFMTSRTEKQKPIARQKFISFKDLESDIEYDMDTSIESSDEEMEIFNVVNQQEEIASASENESRENMKSLVKQLKKPPFKKNRNGVELRVKRVFYFAQKIGVKKEHILKYIEKYPTVLYSKHTTDK